jgi:hypothetical protein
MGKLKYVLFSILLFILWIPASTLAAPAQWGIAINEQTKQCAGYWAGDEFSYYTLPQGWQAYVPDYDEVGNVFIDTANGRCDFSNYSEEDCCRQLELPYLTEQIGTYHPTGLFPDTFPQQDYTAIILLIAVICCVMSILVILGLVFIIKKKRKNNLIFN